MSVKPRKLIGFIYLLWIILISGGVLFKIEPFNKISILITVFLCFFSSVYLNKKIIFFYQKEFLFALLMLLSIGLCVLLNQDFSAWLTYFYMILCIFLGLTLSKILSIHEIIKYYNDIVLFLAIVSLFGFYGLLEYVLAPFKYSFVFRDQDYSYYLFYGQIAGSENRNFSLFVEPGLYQIYLIFSLIFLIYKFDKMDSYYLTKIIIISWAIYTTKSTTAYILVFLIFSYVFLKSGKNLLTKGMYVIIGAIIGIYLINIVGFQENINDKFSGSQATSYLARVESTNIDLILFKDNFITGVGFGNYLSKITSQGFFIDTATNTFTQIAAILGVFPLIWIIGVLVIFFLQKGMKISFRLLYIISILTCFSVQPFVLYPFFYLLIFLTYRFNNLETVKI